MKERINNILYEDVYGVFSKLRKGDYTKNEEQLNTILSYVKEVKSKIATNSYDLNEILDIVTIIYTLLQYTDEEWPTVLASEIYSILVEKGE